MFFFTEYKKYICDIHMQEKTLFNIKKYYTSMIDDKIQIKYSILLEIFNIQRSIATFLFFNSYLSPIFKYYNSSIKNTRCYKLNANINVIFYNIYSYVYNTNNYFFYINDISKIKIDCNTFSTFPSDDYFLEFCSWNALFKMSFNINYKTTDIDLLKVYWSHYFLNLI